MIDHASDDDSGLSRPVRIAFLVVTLAALAALAVNVAFQVFPLWVSAVAVVPAAIGTAMRGRILPGSPGSVSDGYQRTRSVLDAVRNILMVAFLALAIVGLVNESPTVRTVGWAMFLGWIMVVIVKTALTAAGTTRRTP